MKRHNLQIVSRDWTPQRRGAIYCSRACGMGCTHAAFIRATKDASALADRMGEGWKPEVWENLGWHWRVHKGDVATVRACRDGTYDANILTGIHQVIASAKTPEDALGFAVQDARTFISRMENGLTAISE